MALLPEGGVLGAVAGIVAGVLVLRRRWSSDNKLIATEQAETSFQLVLQRRLDATLQALDALQREHNAVQLELGSLRERVNTQARELVVKSNRIRRLERKLNIYIESEHGELDDAPRDESGQPKPRGPPP